MKKAGKKREKQEKAPRGGAFYVVGSAAERAAESGAYSRNVKRHPHGVPFFVK